MEHFLSEFGFKGENFSLLENKNRPIYVYNLSLVKENVEYYRKMWSKISTGLNHIIYSVKANPNFHVISQLSEFVDGFDVSSFEELELVSRLNNKKLVVTISGPAKTDRLLEKAFLLPVSCIHVDSSEELSYIESCFQKSAKKNVKLSLRISLPGVFSEKVGISFDEIKALLGKYKNQELHGFHIYLGRESFKNKIAQEYLNKFSDLRTQFPLAFTKDFEVFLGAGLPAIETQESSFQLWEGVKKPFLFPIHMEAGRTLISSSGCFAVQVLARKRGVDREFVIINGGLQHLAATLPSPKMGNRGLQHEVFRGTRQLSGDFAPMDIYGSLGIWNDLILGGAMLPNQIKRGDWVVFNLCGAYGYTAGANQFIGPELPQEFLLKTIDKKGEPVYLDISPEKLHPYQSSFSEKEKINYECPVS